MDQRPNAPLGTAANRKPIWPIPAFFSALLLIIVTFALISTGRFLTGGFFNDGVLGGGTSGSPGYDILNKALDLPHDAARALDPLNPTPFFICSAGLLIFLGWKCFARFDK